MICNGVSTESYILTWSKLPINEADVVIFASNWSNWQVSFLSESVQNLENEFGNKFWWFGNKHIEFPDERDRLLQKGLLSAVYPIRIEKQHINNLMQKILGYRFINPYDLLCNDGKCRVSNEQGQLLIYDGFHLSREGARYLADQMRMLLPDILDSWLKK